VFTYNNYVKSIYIYIRSDIKNYPPAMSKIISLRSMNYNVYLYTSYLNSDSKKFLNQYNVKYYEYFKNDLLKKNILIRFLSYFLLKLKFQSSLKKINHPNSIIFILSAETLFLFSDYILKRIKIKVILFLYELHDTALIKLFLIKRKSSFVDNIGVPEYNRAFITKHLLNLNFLPFVIPNIPFFDIQSIKPYFFPSEINDLILNNFRIILYQGILNKERPLSQIAHALSKLNEKYLFIIMSNYDEETISRLKKIYKYTRHINFISPPDHLAVTKQAHIGIAIYDDSSLNTIFCAPNKIYEYALFDVPILARNMPGLKYTVDQSHSGLCVDIFNENEVIESIKKIESNYLYYSNNTKNLISNNQISSVLKTVINS